jgi:hypothetical protein
MTSTARRRPERRCPGCPSGWPVSFPGEIAHHAGLEDRLGERLLAVDVLAHAHRHDAATPWTWSGVGDGDGVDLLVHFEHLAEILELHRTWRRRSVSLSPLPPTPMQAMLMRLLRFWPRTMAGAPRTKTSGAEAGLLEETAAGDGSHSGLGMGAWR